MEQTKSEGLREWPSVAFVLLTDAGTDLDNLLTIAVFAGSGVTVTAGKVERFNRTLAAGWAYAKPYPNEAERAAAYDLAASLQSPPTPHRHWRPHPISPRSQRHGELRLRNAHLRRLLEAAFVRG